MPDSSLTTPRSARKRRQARRLSAFPECSGGLSQRWRWSRWLRAGSFGTAARHRSSNPLANARFTPFTDFPGDERDAAISPDGKFVVFRSDRDGPFDAWLGQTDTGHLENLTQGKENDLGLPVRSQGFNGDGSEVWLSGGVDRRLRLMPLVGRREQRDFLGEMAINVAWSADGGRYVYHTRDDGDPIFVADRNGVNPRRIAIDQAGCTPALPSLVTGWQMDLFRKGRSSDLRVGSVEDCG